MLRFKYHLDTVFLCVQAKLWISHKIKTLVVTILIFFTVIVCLCKLHNASPLLPNFIILFQCRNECYMCSEASGISHSPSIRICKVITSMKMSCWKRVLWPPFYVQIFRVWLGLGYFWNRPIKSSSLKHSIQGSNGWLSTSLSGKLPEMGEMELTVHAQLTAVLLWTGLQDLLNFLDSCPCDLWEPLEFLKL